LQIKAYDTGKTPKRRYNLIIVGKEKLKFHELGKATEYLPVSTKYVIAENMTIHSLAMPKG